MKRLPLLAALLLLGADMTPFDTMAWARNGGGESNSAYRYSFSYTPIYQFDTDLDSGGGFDVSRHYVGFSVMRAFSRNLRTGLGLSYGFEKWDFNDQANVAGAAPWDTIHRPGASVPIFYTFADSWTLGVAPAIEFSGEAGADVGQSLTYGGVLSLAHPFGRNLYLGLGFGIFDQLEETSFFPFIVIDWKISGQFRVTNPFRAGPAGPAGLELVYSPARNWEIGAGGAYRSYRFRLDDDGAVPDGVGENEFLVSFLRVQRTFSTRLRLDLAGGMIFGGEISIENADGDKIRSTDYDPAPFVALTFAGEF